MKHAASNSDFRPPADVSTLSLVEGGREKLSIWARVRLRPGELPLLLGCFPEVHYPVGTVGKCEPYCALVDAPLAGLSSCQF